MANRSRSAGGAAVGPRSKTGSPDPKDSRLAGRLRIAAARLSIAGRALDDSARRARCNTAYSPVAPAVQCTRLAVAAAAADAATVAAVGVAPNVWASCGCRRRAAREGRTCSGERSSTNTCCSGRRPPHWPRCSLAPARRSARASALAAAVGPTRIPRRRATLHPCAHQRPRLRQSGRRSARVSRKRSDSRSRSQRTGAPS